MTKLKQCRNCKAIKSLQQFHKQDGGKDGRRPTCKDCDHEAQRQRKTAQRGNRNSLTQLMESWGR